MDLNLNKSIIADDYVFFSYSHSNKEQVYEIKKIIEEKGYSVVLDTKMSSGDLWTQRAKEFIRNSHCKAVLFFISDSSVVSAPVLRELEFTNRYDRPYCAVLLDDETVDEKFERINDSNTSEELKDIVDNMRDYFPDEKLYILNDKSLVTKVCEFLNNNGLRANDNQKIENINSENISPKAEIDKRVSDNRERYVVIEGDEITPEDIQSALNLERKFLDVDDDEQFGLEKCLVWFKKNKWIYTFLKDTQTGEVIANIDAEPVTKSCYKEILSGKYPDIEINDEDIESFDMPGFYYMYFASIVVNQDYQDVSILFKLYHAFIQKIINLSNNGINIRSMVADAVSKHGVKFCEMFGMKKIKETKHDSVIYEVSLLPPEFNVSSKLTKELFDVYDEKARALGLKK